MTNQLPDPPIPPHVDLRGFQYMALDVVRLRDSELSGLPEAEAFRVAVLSWCVSWHQVPAASLPNDDKWLARNLGFGRDVKGWQKVREAGGLRGWVLCSDGRLYHPVVAAKAIEAAGQKQSAKRKREQDAERLRRWRNERGLTEDEWAKLRAHVFTRDGWRCKAEGCGSVEDLHCDHVMTLQDGGTNDPSNLITLCRTCHARKTALEDGAEGNASETRFNAATSHVSSPRDQIGSDQIRSDPSLTSPPSPCLSAREGFDVEPKPVPVKAPIASVHKAQGATIAPREGSPSQKATATVLGQRVNALDAEALRLAIESGDAMAVVRVFHVTPGHEGEWLRDTDGMQVGEVAVVLAWCRWHNRPVRMPSGFRSALTEWRQISIAKRRDSAASLLAGFGIVADVMAAGVTP